MDKASVYCSHVLAKHWYNFVKNNDKQSAKKCIEDTNTIFFFNQQFFVKQIVLRQLL